MDGISSKKFLEFINYKDGNVKCTITYLNKVKNKYAF